MSANTQLIRRRKTVGDKLRELWGDRRGFVKRLLTALAVVGAAAFIFVFFGPFEMIAGSGNSLFYTTADVWWLLAFAALGVTLVGSLLLALLRGKIFNYAVSLAAAVTLGGFVQGLLLNGSLGALTGDTVDWNGYRDAMLLGLAVWGAIFAAILFVMYLNRKIWRRMLILLSLCLIVIQAVPLGGVIAAGAEQTAGGAKYSLTDAGMKELSSKDNIFVFVLDRLDYDYIETLLQKQPDFFERMDGFTMYDNATSVFARTQPALSHMLTGAETLAYSIPDSQYYNDSWTDGEKNLLGDLKEQGYSSELYTNYKYLFSDADYAEEYVKNVSDGKGRLDNYRFLVRMLYLSAYRYAPTALKPFYFNDTNYYNDVFIKEEISKYKFDDAAHAQSLVGATAERTEKAFKFYHFYGPHAPYTLNADGTRAEGKTDVQTQLAGSFENLHKIFTKMKELGVYKDATIIITGDHGSAVSDAKPVQKATRIGLFYKPSGAEGTPLQMSDAPVSTANIPATIMKEAGGDYAAYGLPLDEVTKENTPTRSYYKSVHNPETKDEIEIYKYSIVGNAADFENWRVEKSYKIEHSFY